MIDSGDLIRLAIALASGGVGGGGRGRPRVIDLRNAVRATYYAMFHALALTCANTLVGASGATRNRQAWRQTYRALNHGYARRQFSRKRMMSEFPIEARRFGRLFNEMQRRRHSADYDPFPQEAFRRGQVLREIEGAERVINDFLALPADDRRAFAVYALLPMRND